jgi:hypothetical protein
MAALVELYARACHVLAALLGDRGGAAIAERKAVAALLRVEAMRFRLKSIAALRILDFDTIEAHVAAARALEVIAERLGG